MKFELIGVRRANDKVAPLAGAWIEIMNRQTLPGIRKVAPLAGAWIEMLSVAEQTSVETGRSPRGSVD